MSKRDEIKQHIIESLLGETSPDQAADRILAFASEPAKVAAEAAAREREACAALAATAPCGERGMGTCATCSKNIALAIRARQEPRGRVPTAGELAHDYIDNTLNSVVKPSVEVVARAIDPDVFLLPRIALYQRRYDEAFAKARAALAAIRTPTPDMIEAMQQPATWTEAFEAAIDAAMKE